MWRSSNSDERASSVDRSQPIQHAPAALSRLDRLCRFDAFDQQSCLEIGQLLVALRQCGDAPGTRQTQHHADDQESQRDVEQRSGDGPDDADEDQRERRVHGDMAGQCHQESADTLVASQLAGQAAHAAGHLIEAYGQETRVDRTGQRLIDMIDDTFVQARAQQLGAVFDQDGRQHAQGQDQQGLHGRIGNDPVVDLHGIEGNEHTQNGQQQSADGGLGHPPSLRPHGVQDFAQDGAVRGDIRRGQSQAGDHASGESCR